MCGRYEIGPTPKIKELLENTKNTKKSYSFKQGEIFPGDIAPVICLNKELKPQVYLMKWGYSLNDSLIFNARSESVKEKKMFKDDINKHRCLVIANHYYEWDKEKNKYKIYLDDEIIYMAGIFKIENDNLVFTILTKEASSTLNKIHHRMPVILSDLNKDKWLNLSIDAQDIIESSVQEMKYELIESR